MHVCMHVCMEYADMHAYMYVVVYVCVYVCNVYVYVCMDSTPNASVRHLIVLGFNACSDRCFVNAAPEFLRFDGTRSLLLLSCPRRLFGEESIPAYIHDVYDRVWYICQAYSPKKETGRF